jgi:serine/threonine protein kinase
MAQKIGKYEVIEELGRGAMGVVYKCRDPFIGRMVALKTITTGLQDQPELLQRFYREAQAAGGLAHPNIVTIFDLGEGQDGTPYIAMEFLEGTDLEHIIADGTPLPMAQKIGYMVQAARALDYAHKRGVVHRDIKPANIVVTKDGTIKVVDFGIARLVDTSRSQTGLLIGTVNYMSPEQVRGERCDGRSDIFSFGVMFYELLSGQRPFNGNNFTAVMLAIISQNHKPLKEVMEGCPQELSDVVEKILRKDVGDRYQALEEFLLDVDPVWKKLQGEEVKELVAEGERLIATRDFTKARDILRKAVQTDTANKHAKTLLEKVNAELKRSLALPEAQEHVSKAESLLKEGKLAEAQAEVEAALKLDSVYQPAQELRQKVLDESNRQQSLKDYLKSTKQRLAEGDLTAADQSLKKVLEIQADSKEGAELRKQLEEEKNRRSKRQKLLDSMQQARNLWTAQNHAESISILTALQKEFPGEAEVTKLLETVREDQAEQEKHAKLAEAKSLLNGQRFADALAVLEPIVQKHKDDPAVTKLYEHIQAERKVHAQRVRFDKELAALKKLVADEKFREALDKGEPLLKEFPEEVELARLIEYSRGQQETLDKQSKVKNAIKEVEALFDKGNFAEAAKAADKWLDSFPGNMDLKALLDDSRAKLKDKEKKDFIEQKIRSIKAAIDSGNLTDAIDIGRQTIAQVKHDTDITKLMQFAERERELRDEKVKQDENLKTIAILVKKKDFEKAGKALKDASKTQIFNPLDPRVQELMKAIEEKRAPSEAVMEKGPPVAGTVAGQYVFAPGKPSVLEPEQAPVGAQASAQPVPVQPTPIPVAPPPKFEPEKPAPAKPEVKPAAPPAKPPVEEPKKAKPAVEEPPKKPAVEEPKKAKPAVEEPPPVKEKKPPVEEKKKAAPVEAPPKPRVEEPKPAPRPAPPVAPPVEEKKSPVVMIAIAAVVVIGIGFGVWKFMGSSGGLTAEQQQTLTTAQGFYGERKLDQALTEYQKLSALNNADVTAKITEIQGILKTEADAISAGQAALKSKDFATAKAKFQEAINANGMRRSEAESGLKTANSLAAGADPAKLSKDAYARAQSAIKSRDWARAITNLNEVIGYGQAEAARAQSDLQTAQTRQLEKTAYDEGVRLLASNKDAAKAKFEEVVKMNGLLKNDGQTQLDVMNTQNVDAARGALVRQAEGYISAGNLAEARQLLAQIEQLNGRNEAATLRGRIDSAEQSAYNSLAGRVAAARNAKNDDELRDLQTQLRGIAGSQSSQASNANTLAGQIDAYIKEIGDEKARLAEAERQRLLQQEQARFDSAVSAFNAAVAAKNKAALEGAVTRDFGIIANAGGNKAAEAREYLNTRIPEALKVFAERPCLNFVPVGGGAGGGVNQTYKAGDPVPSGQLDTKPAWTSCKPYPQLSAQTGILIKIDASGNVADVTPRIGTPADFAAAKAAVMQWKVTPPPTWKGLGVTTTTPLDLKP